MRCTLCGRTNEQGAKACVGCGLPLECALVCDSCGMHNEPDQRFCGDCGLPLVVQGARRTARRDEVELPARISAQLHAAQRATDRERKQVTVLFADVTSATDASDELDTEHWWQTRERCLDLLADGVHRYEGLVHAFTGEGVVAVFGAPLAYEDHARRAAQAAIDLREELARYAHDLARERGASFAVRMGLNSGEVVAGTIGDDLRVEYAAIGRAVGLAERMMGIAEPGSIYLSESTARLIEGYFQLADLGEFDVRGARAAVRAFALLGAGSLRTRFDVSRARGLTPFVGRGRQRAVLEEALERALEGDGQAVALAGDAGVGKSRLAHEFTGWCAARGVAVHRSSTQAHGPDAPLLPILEIWRAMIGVTAPDEPSRARVRIAQSVLALDAAIEEDVPLVADFLGVADPERPPPRMDPEARQRRLLALLRELVRASAAANATVVLIEDLHWLDEASSVFVAELIAAAAGTRTLVVLTQRPEYSSELLDRPHCTRLTVPPLTDDDVRELLTGLLGADPSLDGLGDLIAARASGNPFFCEELVAALAESAILVGARGDYRLAQTLEEIVLPATVHATLAARIDRLPRRERELVHIAAVLGRRLSASLLREISGLGEAELSEALGAAVASELLSEEIGESDVEYAFKHPLTQEVAYRTQLSDRRERVHHNAALALERLYPERLDEMAALVARHYEAGGDALAAARFNARAAVWLGLSDISQAVAHWRKVGELVEPLTDLPEATGLAIIAHVRQLDFGWRLGMSEEEAEAHYRAGRELALRSGNQVSLLGITDVYANVRGLSGHAEHFGELAEEGDRLSREIGDPGVRIAAAVVTIYSRTAVGKSAEAIALADEMIALSADNHALGMGLGVVCPRAFCLVIRGSLLSHMGHLDEAAGALEDALEVARAQGDLENEAFAHGAIVVLTRYTGETEIVLDHATRCFEIAERIGSTLSLAIASGVVGRAHLILDRAGEAIGPLEQALRLARESRTGLENEAYWLEGLSEALLAVGDRARALEAAQTAVTLAHRRGTKLLYATCHRALAEALLGCGDPGSVTSAEQALAAALEAVEETGVRAELPFIERARERLTLARS